MIYNDTFVFAHLQKTGGTAISRCLCSLLPSIKVSGKHDRLAPFLKRTPREFVLASVRDPFEMYVSLWSYGCSGKGGLFFTLTKANIFRALKFSFFCRSFRYCNLRRRPNYSVLYSDVRRKDLFHAWVEAINSPSNFCDVKLNMPLYFESGEKIGFLSRRFIYQYCDYRCDSNLHLIESSIKVLPKYFIRTESMLEDLFTCIEAMGTPSGITKQDIDNYLGKVNTSEHEKVEYYYNSHVRKIIVEQERFLFEILSNL